MTIAPTLRYRPEVDGLRAVAVVPVVLYHAGYPGFHGGFLGVDVFFVISGYLITSLIAADLDRGAFSLVGFYERRVRRILPALYTVLAFSALAAVATLHPATIEEFGESLLSVMFFVANIYFWQVSGYFGSAAEMTPLLHTWSLSVEEQFYLLFPLLLMLIWASGRRRVVLLLALLALCSLGLAEWGSRRDVTANFFLTPSRAWELLIGALVALAPRDRLLQRLGRRVRDSLCALALLALALSFVVYDEATPHPALPTLLPVAATAGILLFCDGGGFSGRLLRHHWMVGIGLLSYSLYLWHQPLFVFARHASSGHPGPLVFALLSLISLGLAYLSWRFVEKPFRDRRHLARRRVFSLAATTSLMLVVLGGGLMAGSGLPLRLSDPESYVRYEIIRDADPRRRPMAGGECHLWSDRFTDEFRNAFARCSARHGRAVFVAGDSAGMDLYNAIARNTDHPFVASVSREMCRPHAMIGWRPPHPCPYEELVGFVREQRDAITILFYTQAPDRLYRATWNRGFGDLTWIHEASADDLALPLVEELVNYLSRLQRESGVQLVMLGMLPPIREDPSAFDFREPIEAQLAAAHSPQLVELSLHIDRVLAPRLEPLGIPYVSKLEAFELRLPEDLLVDGRMTYSDRRHLTIAGERYFGRKLVHYLSVRGYLGPEGNSDHMP